MTDKPNTLDDQLRKIDIDRTEYIANETLSLGYHLSSSEIAQIKATIYSSLEKEIPKEQMPKGKYGGEMRSFSNGYNQALADVKDKLRSVLK